MPAGSGRESGQWTNGGGGSARAQGRPVVIIDTSDLDNDAAGVASDSTAGSALINDSRVLSDFDPDPILGCAQYAQLGDPPRGVGDNKGPPLEEPPEIPSKMPQTADERMGFVRQAARWLSRVGRLSPLADAFLGAAEQVEEINRLTHMIRTANDPPRDIDELRDRYARK